MPVLRTPPPKPPAPPRDSLNASGEIRVVGHFPVEDHFLGLDRINSVAAALGGDEPFPVSLLEFAGCGDDDAFLPSFRGIGIGLDKSVHSKIPFPSSGGLRYNAVVEAPFRAQPA